MGPWDEQTHQRHTKPAHHRLPLAADIEQPGMEGDGHGWGGEKLVRTLNQTVRFFEEKLKK